MLTAAEKQWLQDVAVILERAKQTALTISEELPVDKRQAISAADHALKAIQEFMVLISQKL